MLRFARIMRCTSNPHYIHGPKTNYYTILGVQRNATDKEIKKAYREKAKLFHPDKNPDDETAVEKFKEVQTAYATLGNSWKKTLYDQDLHFETQEDLNKHTTGVDDWAKAAMNETPEMKQERRERYRRYAQGVRNDMPPPAGGWTNRHHVIALFCALGGVAGLCAWIPQSENWVGGGGYHSMRHWMDPAFDDKSVPLVRAYHNPVNNRWERLPEGLDPPNPDEFYEWIDEHQPDLWKGVNRAKLPRMKLTCTRVPKSQTKVAFLANDLKGNLVVNANSPEMIREARRKAIEAAEGTIRTPYDNLNMNNVMSKL